MTTQCVQVKIELGHRANLRPKPTAEGFTHDWTVFVRGPEGNNIQHFVEKVVFQLHESFPKPKRVVKEHPYQVSESGYAGFNLQIEVYFKNKEEPKKVTYTYDLFLLGDKPTSYFRIEQLTFLNPTEDFRRRLIKAGGVGIIQSEDGTLLNPLQRPSPRPSTPTSLTHSKPAKHVSDAVKAPKSSAPANTVLGPNTNTPLAPTKLETKNTGQLHPQQAFVDLFGQPIKPNKASPEPHKVKESHLKGSSKLSRSSHSVSLSSDAPPINCIGAKDIKTSSHKEGKDLKDSKNCSRDKRGGDGSTNSSLKRPISPLLSPISDPVKKKKVAPFSGESVKQKDIIGGGGGGGGGGGSSGSGKEKRKSEKKSSSSKDKERKEKKDKHKQINSNSGDGSSGNANIISSNNNNNNSSSSVDRKLHADVSGGSNNNNNRESNHSSSKSARKHKGSSSHQTKSNGVVGNDVEELSKSSARVQPPQQSPVQNFDEVEDASPSSSISFSSVHHGNRGNGPLNALMAELDEQGDDKLLTPLSSDSASSRSPSPVVKDHLVAAAALTSKPRHTGHPSLPPPPPPPPPPPLATQQTTVCKQPPPSLSVVTSTSQPPPPPSTDKTERVNLKEEKRASKVDSRSSQENKEKKSKKSHSHHNKSDKSGGAKLPTGETAATVVCGDAAATTTTVVKRQNKAAVKEMDSKHSSSVATVDLASSEAQQRQLPLTDGGGGISHEYICELKDLQRQIMSLRDRKHLQQIVNVIEETGLYQVTSTTFDFDLCTLDHGTVKKLQNCLAAVV